jgi:anion-transporting  ArsA/GET3 family ATPase
MTRCQAAPSIRLDVKADGAPGGVELRLASIRHKLPELWDRAAAALAEGQDHLAGLALRRRQVLLRELDNLSQLIAAQAPRARVLSRIEAADRLLDASLSEASRTSQPPPREPVALDQDPAVQSDLQRLRAELRNETVLGTVSEEQEGGC